MKKIAELKITENFGIPEIDTQEVYKVIQAKSAVQLVDVRRPEEFVGELGHIQDAILKTLGPELTQYLETADRETPIVFVCRSGARSGQATSESLALGFKTVANMTGGMIKWNSEKLPTQV